MSTAWLRRLLAAGVIGSMLLGVPGSAVATVTGGCTARGTASGSAGSDITVAEEWDLKSTDVVSGDGTSPSLMTSATLYAYALGLRVPVVSGSGKGDTSGSVDSISLDTFSKLGKIFVVAGNATGPGGSCDGQILIVLDDVDALFTVLGGGGILLAVLFLGAMLMTIGRPGCASKVLGGLCGGFGLASGAIAASQFNLISPTSPIGAAIALVGLVLGFLLAGSGAAKPPAATPAMAATTTPPIPTPPPSAPTAAPPPTDETEGFVSGVVAPAMSTGASAPDPEDRTPEESEEIAIKNAQLSAENAQLMGSPPEPDPDAPTGPTDAAGGPLT
jgi:hypothetical protein